MNGEDKMIKVNTYLALKEKHGNNARAYLYKKAIMKYGRPSRLNLAVEEMSELTKEICKHIRGECRFDEIAEEMADVEIMLEQLKMMFENSRHVSMYKEQKLQRLADRMDQNSD